MKARFLILIVILLLIAIPAAAQQISKRISALPSTNAVSATDSVIISSGASPSTKTITTSNLLDSLLLFPNWPAPWLTNHDSRSIFFDGTSFVVGENQMVVQTGPIQTDFTIRNPDLTPLLYLTSLPQGLTVYTNVTSRGVFSGNGSGLSNLSYLAVANAPWVNSNTGEATNLVLRVINPSGGGGLIAAELGDGYIFTAATNGISSGRLVLGITAGGLIVYTNLSVRNDAVISGNGSGLTNLPSTALAAPDTTAWGGPTNSITVSYPWTDYTLYSVASDCSITNLLGVTTNKRLRASLVFTNATTSNCTFRLPAQWRRFGSALATNSFTLTNGGAMLKLDVEAASLTNAVAAYSQ